MNVFALISGGALWVALPLAMLAGLISFFSPCVLPLVPGYLGYIGGATAPRDAKAPVGERASRAGAASTSSASTSASSTVLQASGVEASGAAASDSSGAGTPGLTRARLLGGVLLFVAGFTVVFLSINVFTGVLGRFFMEYTDIILRILGVVVIVMGLIFVGAIRFAQRSTGPRVGRNLGLAGAPLLGLAFGIGWAPCIGPTLAAILTLSWSSADPWRAAALGLAYSLGLGIPFLLIAWGFGWAARSVAFVRRHIRAVNLIGGGLLITLGVLMITGLWTIFMSQLVGVIAGVEPPI